jgi:two-component system KDP operon response regulator KdpE
MHILLIGNDRGTVGDLAGAISGNQVHLQSVASEAEALAVLSNTEPSLILLEVQSPETKVLSLCRRLRARFPLPIVICSTSGREQDVVRALEAGADDYLVMPIRPAEMMARLRAVLRRVGDASPQPANGQRLRRGTEIDLSPIEFKLLALLVRETGRPVSHSRLIAQVWGPEYVDCRHYLRLYIRYLRAKIEDIPETPELIQNEWGVGYRFEPAAA